MDRGLHHTTAGCRHSCPSLSLSLSASAWFLLQRCSANSALLDFLASSCNFSRLDRPRQGWLPSLLLCTGISQAGMCVFWSLNEERRRRKPVCVCASGPWSETDVSPSAACVGSRPFVAARQGRPSQDRRSKTEQRQAGAR
ncbi:hypothetical protein LZ31DRAFT_233013 [Colletotrichum somersetense]|nr:hypothetical protein LZ31DRAFT_233013 [Colletotrichum somersetense]